MSSQRKLSSYSVFFIPWITPENKPSRAKVFHIKKVKSKSISYYAFSSLSSEEHGESEILIAYLVLLSSTHLRPLPAHFKNKPVLRYFFKNKSTSQTKQEESEVHPRADESGLIQEFKKMPHLRGDRTTWSMWRHVLIHPQLSRGALARRRPIQFKMKAVENQQSWPMIAY